jgi:membrane dipeptidase
MREIADKGGVVGIYLIAYLRSGIGQPALNARREDLIAHLEHAVAVCGEDHVGIGSDGSVSMFVIDEQALANQKKRFEERTRQGVASAGEGPDVFNFVEGYNSPRRLFTLAQDLSQRGWSSAKIEKIIGGNFARLFSTTWDA